MAARITRDSVKSRRIRQIAPWNPGTIQAHNGPKSLMNVMSATTARSPAAGMALSMALACNRSDAQLRPGRSGQLGLFVVGSLCAFGAGHQIDGTPIAAAPSSRQIATVAMKRDWLEALGGVLVLLGCGSRSGATGSVLDEDAALYPWQPGAESAPSRTAPECIQNWRTLYEADGMTSTTLAAVNDEVIFGVIPASGAPQIRALDLSSPESYPRVVRDGVAADEGLWVEGDRLLVWSRGRLLRIPLAGGNEEVLVDAQLPDASRAIESVWVNSGAAYWTRTGSEPTLLEIWRQQPLDGGRPEHVANIENRALDAELMAASSDVVVVAGTRSAVAVSLPSGSSQPLDALLDGELAGVDDLGAYYVRASNRTRRGGSALAFELRRAPADGSPATRFWRREPGHRLNRLWPADSGWLATGSYYMFDGTPHAVIAHIDSAGSEVLIACDRGDNALTSRPVYWEGAFYAVTRVNNRHRIVEIRLAQ